MYVTVEVAGETTPQVIPLDSKHAKAVVRNRLCDLVKRGFPTDHETRTAIDVLHGYAFEQKRQVPETSLEHLIGAKPPAHAESSLYAVSCRPLHFRDRTRIEAWEHTLAVGSPLPTLPLWISDSKYVPLELERTYLETCKGLRIG